MWYKENLSYILKCVNEPIKVIAAKMQVSPNTLSNILNGKVEPTLETKNKISKCLKEYGFTEKDFDKDFNTTRKFRIRTSKELSGYEKALLRDDLFDFSRLINHSDEKIQKYYDYIDYCDKPTNESDQETVSDRREYFLNLIKNRDYFDDIYNFYFRNTIIDNYKAKIGRINITHLLDMLGIRIFFKSLHTEKIISFSTAFYESSDNPIILINTKVCNTMEKCFIALCKELYFIIAFPNDYEIFDISNIKTDNQDTNVTAEIFAENVLLNIDALNYFINEKKDWIYTISFYEKNDSKFFFKVYEFDYLINWIKREFRVSYKLAIQQLLKSNFKYKAYFNDYDEAEKFYCDCLKKSEQQYDTKTVYLNGEPFPEPIDFRRYDAAMLSEIDIE